MPSTRPHWLYYESQKAAVEYTSTPTGPPDMNRVVQQYEQCFKKEGSTSQKKPKTLLLRDWTAEQWSEEKALAIQRCLLELLEEGHALYVAIPADARTFVIPLQPLQLYNLTARYYREKIGPTKKEVLLQLMANKKIPASQLEMLDCVRLEEMIYDKKRNENRKGKIFLEEYLNSTFNNEELIENITQEYGSQITNDIFSGKYLKKEKELKDKFNIETIKKYTAIFNRDLNASLDESINWPNCTKICFFSNKEEQINSYLNKASSVKNLYCSGLTFLQSNLDLEAIKNINNIEFLSINKSDLQSVGMLLSHAASLKHLDLSIELGNNFKPENIRDAFWENLEGLSINGLEACQWNVILKRTTHLKYLSIINGKNLKNLDIASIYNDIAPNSLWEQLESLTIKNGDIDTDTVSNILMSTKNLKELILDFDIKNHHNLFEALKHVAPTIHSLTLTRPIFFENNANHLKNLTVRLNNTEQANAFVMFFILGSKNGSYIQNLETLSIQNINFLKFDQLNSIHSLGHRLDKTSKKILVETLINKHKDKYGIVDLKTKTTYKQPGRTSVDLNTKLDANKCFNLNQIFWSTHGSSDPHPAHYRLSILNTLEITKNRDLPFILSKTGDLNLIPLAHNPQFSKRDTFALAIKKDNLYYGKITLILTNDWQALPSLSVNDKLTHIHIDGMDKDDIELQYSLRDNLTYIKRKKPLERKMSDLSSNQPTAIDFLIKTSDLSHRTAEGGSDFLQSLVESYNRTKPNEALGLQLPKDATVQDHLMALKTQKIGACRHKAIAFYDQITTLGLTARIISNDCHMIVEVKEDNQWFVCDLGGHPAELNIDQHNAPTGKTQAPQKITLSAHTESIQPLIDTSVQTIEHSPFNRWSNKLRPEASITEYVFNKARGKDSDSIRIHPSTLITLQSTEDIYNLRFLLIQNCVNTHRAVYYIDSAEDFACSAPFITRDTKDANKGVLKKPGGPLYHFLTTATAPLLIVNFDNLKTSELAKFNTILDKNPSIDTIKLPENTQVVGLYNPTRLGAYQGSDFFSRFSQISPFPFDTQCLENDVGASRVLATEAMMPSADPIELCNSEDWKSLLEGTWKLQGDSLTFSEGLLKPAIQKANESNCPIEIKNGLWQNDKFVQFFERARLQGFIDIYGERLDFPKTLPLTKSSGYDWSDLIKNLTNAGPNPPDKTTPWKILNPATLGSFFNDYKIENEKYYPSAGWLAQYKNKTIEIYLSRDLSHSQWARLLAGAKKYKCTLAIRSAPELNLMLNELQASIRKHDPIKPGLITIYASNDVDETVNNLSKNHKITSIIDISEIEASALLVSIKHHVDIENHTFRFYSNTNALLQSIENNESLILKGNFNQDLVDALATFCIPGTQESPENLTNTAKLFIVCSDAQANLFNFSKINNHHFDRTNDQSFIQRTTATHYLKHNPNSKLDENWQGLTDLKIPDWKATDNFDLSSGSSVAVEQARYDSIDRTLKNNPFVFIAGPTGSGKSTFVLKRLEELSHNTYEIYPGIDKLSEWAKSEKTKKIKAIFIDEANINSGNFSAFEGLYNNPPGMLINGFYTELSPNHKVIFAGNPLSYGDRNLPSLFARHGNSIVFSPLTPAYLYNNILQPIFRQNKVDDKTEKILQIYSKICSLSPINIAISPRELQTMALLSINKNLHTIYSIAEQCVSNNQRELFKTWYTQNIDWPTDVVTISEPALNSGFVLSASKMRASQDILSFLQIRDRKKAGKSTAAGLGGVIIEGEPGIGKSAFIIALLISKGFEEIHPTNPHPQTKDKIFYQIPSGMQPSEKEALLIKAFKEGAMVIMDEINTSPIKEDLLNALLMGYDLAGKPSPTPGFMIIATQNPITMEGRMATSLAIDRRFFKIALPPYTPSEMQTILETKGIAAQKAQALILDYETTRSYAIQYHKTPIPNFRDLITHADNIITAQTRHVSGEQPTITPPHQPSPPMLAQLNIHSTKQELKTADLPRTDELKAADLNPRTDELKKTGLIIRKT